MFAETNGGLRMNFKRLLSTARSELDKLRDKAFKDPCSTTVLMEVIGMAKNGFPISVKVSENYSEHFLR
ncbi:hypothetical protein AUR04nite_35220 [Glutamicibacter uratoxydans]|uniref:Uncharacterized protein n=1 Tax=Glutamicibacter uratoxydans TaxID=43667 RepID=A0A4Y4DX46_GLUUR|nr:hypothetical protein AUR04nite_35220 [Glutamicibacter uratoxydans]